MKVFRRPEDYNLRHYCRERFEGAATTGWSGRGGVRRGKLKYCGRRRVGSYKCCMRRRSSASSRAKESVNRHWSNGLTAISGERAFTVVSTESTAFSRAEA